MVHARGKSARRHHKTLNDSVKVCSALFGASTGFTRGALIEWFWVENNSSKWSLPFVRRVGYLRIKSSCG